MKRRSNSSTTSPMVNVNLMLSSIVTVKRRMVRNQDFYIERVRKTGDISRENQPILEAFRFKIV
jgi:hypothetical protein